MSSATTVWEAAAICSTFFTGDKPAAGSAGAGFDKLFDSRRESSGDAGVDTTDSDALVPGVIAVDTNDWLLSSCVCRPQTNKGRPKKLDLFEHW